MIHTIIALDTWGPSTTNALLSVAGVKVDISKEGGEADAYYAAISLRSCYVYDLTLDPDTITHWLGAERPIVVNQAFARDKHDLPVAMEGLLSWYGSEPTPTWCVSATHNNAANQLQHTCQKLGLEIPWPMSQMRDYETLKTIVKELPTPDNHDSYTTSLEYARHIAHNLWFLYEYLET